MNKIHKKRLKWRKRKKLPRRKRKGRSSDFLFFIFYFFSVYFYSLTLYSVEKVYNALLIYHFMLNNQIKQLLEKQHYALVGNHSAIQICRWTKRSLLDDGFCYKQQFYGVESHRCCQMSPCLYCPNKCLHCWRAIEFSTGKKIEGIIDKPQEIIKNCILAQKKMLSGFKGNSNINLKKFKEAQSPSQFAISLSGEPTLYPYLGELINELKKQKKTSFVVTNALFPEKLFALTNNHALPTQLYISLNSPSKKMYEQWHRSIFKDAWKRFNESLSIFSKIQTRKVIRMTLVKDLNMKDEMIEGYSKLIKKASPNFIEVKGYISIGYARNRLGYDKMPTHDEVRQFAKKLELALKEKAQKYSILDEKPESKVVLLGKNKDEMKITKTL